MAAVSTSCPSSKDTVLTLLSREVRFDNVQSQRLKRKQRALGSPNHSESSAVSSKAFSETVSEEHRYLASEWMHEVVIDSKVKSEVFLLSVTIMDSFLDICPILFTNQVQLLASACLLLADKVRRSCHCQNTRHCGQHKALGEADSPTSDFSCPSAKNLSEAQIIDYTDNSITYNELKAWEMLVLSKLDWDVNFVIALDYLEPLNSLLSTSENLPQASPMETNELKNLICTLSKRYTTFRAIYTARIVACSALNLTENPEMLEILGLNRTTENTGHVRPDETKSGKALENDKVLLKECSKEFKSLPSESCKTPPLSNNQLSPFKAESTSTPKSSRTPLRNNNNVNVNSEINPSVNTTPTRRRLTSLCGGEESKENNDSGFGLLLSTSVESQCSKTPSVSSKNSSKQSSPDSGASSETSPKTNKDVQELDKLLESTHINISQ